MDATYKNEIKWRTLVETHEISVFIADEFDTTSDDELASFIPTLKYYYDKNDLQNCQNLLEILYEFVLRNQVMFHYSLLCNTLFIDIFNSLDITDIMLKLISILLDDIYFKNFAENSLQSKLLELFPSNSYIINNLITQCLSKMKFLDYFNTEPFIHYYNQTQDPVVISLFNRIATFEKDNEQLFSQFQMLENVSTELYLKFLIICLKTSHCFIDSFLRSNVYDNLLTNLNQESSSLFFQFTARLISIGHDDYVLVHFDEKLLNICFSNYEESCFLAALSIADFLIYNKDEFFNTAKSYIPCLVDILGTCPYKVRVRALVILNSIIDNGTNEDCISIASNIGFDHLVDILASNDYDFIILCLKFIDSILVVLRNSHNINVMTEHENYQDLYSIIQEYASSEETQISEAASVILHKMEINHILLSD